MGTADQSEQPSSNGSESQYRWVFHLLLVLLILFGIFARYTQKKDPLSIEERRWINANAENILLIESCHFPPIEFLDDTGAWDGISRDYIELIEQRLGFTFTRQRICDYHEAMMALYLEVPVVKCNIQKTPERSTDLNFTEPYIELPNAIIVRNEIKTSLHLAELKDLTISLVEDSAIQEYLQTNYPRFKLDPVPDPLEGLQKVAFGQSDAMILNLAVASYYIEAEGLTNLRMAGAVGESNKLSFASSNRFPMLNRILIKGLAQISGSEKKTVLKKWIRLQQDGFVYSIEFWYTTGAIVLVILLITGFITIWNRTLRVQVNQKTRELKRELAEKKKMERQLIQSEKMEAIGIFAGGIAHDFNNALGAIIGYCELIDMIDARDGTRLKWRTKHALKAAYRAKGLVQQILTFSRQTEQRKVPIHLNPIVKEVMGFMRATLPATIEIRKTVTTENDVINADPTQIHRLLMNLCANAAHAMGDEGGVLEVAIYQCDRLPEDARLENPVEEDSYICIEVSDSGTGIEPTNLDKIFQPFFTTKSRGEGTGMGLAVVHGIVRDLKGSFTVESELGKGSRFSFFFPECYSEANATEWKEIDLNKNIKGNILFIDDEEPLTGFVEEVLTHYGFSVITSNNAVEALEIFWEDPERVDMVISDVTMPAMTGIELAEEILSVRPEMPVVLCTGYAASVSEEQIINIGVRALVHKPLGINQLLNIVRQELQTVGEEE